MSPSNAQYEALAEQIESILQDPESSNAQIKDDQIRRRLVEDGRRLAGLLEDPRDTVCRIGYSHLQLPLAFVGVETGVFAALAADARPFNSVELADKTGVDKSLLKRLLRYYQASGMIAQTADDDTYQSSNVTRALSNDDHAKSLRWTREITAQGASNFPNWLRSNQYRDPVGLKPTAWTSAVHTDKDPYEWLADNPWALDLAQAHMRTHREGRPVFFDALDFERRFAQDTTSSTVLFVDVGGSTGSQCITLRQRYPDLPGRVLLQDRPEVVEQVQADLASSAEIEAKVYDIFTPQPVKGARAYYLRNIFHAWGDTKCVEILANAKAGMTEQSVILIDEIVIPEKGATARGAQLDMEVMICVGGIERTKAQWGSLLNDAGLKLREVVKYDEDSEDSLIVASLN